MSAYTIETLDPRAYLYVDAESPLNPEAMAAAIGPGFARVQAALAQAGAAPVGWPMVLYTVMDPTRMVFRVGFFVDDAGAAAATGDVHLGHTPGGPAVCFTHIGPYDQLSASYDAVIAALKRDGHDAGMPTWEVYVNDPGSTAPEDLRTQICMVLGSP